ncbi:lipoyl domain-containing protein [Streptomyces achromogenes]|uniref:lipoyl domain-containing protein n=1 Tax=Streptomyces achromogenes TaxID=67255 RepID=UPI003679614F
MTKTARGRIPRFIGESCLAATLALSTGVGFAAAASQNPAAVQAPTQPSPPSPPGQTQEPSPPSPPGQTQEADVVLPALGEPATEATVVRWLKKVGEPVEAGEPLVEVETAKVNTEIEAPASGVLRQIVIAEDETAQPGDTLGVIGAPPASAD